MARTSLVLLAAALAVASVAAHDSSGAYWTSLSYPVGQEKHHARASPMVEIADIGEAGHIAYHTIYRSDQVPGMFAGKFCAQRLKVSSLLRTRGLPFRNTRYCGAVR